MEIQFFLTCIKGNCESNAKETEEERESNRNRERKNWMWIEKDMWHKWDQDLSFQKQRPATNISTKQYRKVNDLLVLSLSSLYNFHSLNVMVKKKCQTLSLLSSLISCGLTLKKNPPSASPRHHWCPREQ